MITPANLLGVALLGACLGHAVHADIVDVGPRPLSLVAQMEEGDLKTALRACAGQSMQRTLFSIGHRGAPLMFPEHTVEGNVAAARMGAGILECDVTFTRDLELVCRHAQDDLHATTNILGTPLAGKCRQGSTRVSDDTPAVVECRASDLTLAEFRTLSGRMKTARSASGSGAASMDGSPDWRGDPRAASAGTLMTHAESIALFRSLGAKFAPELKPPVVDMPFRGFSQHDYAQKLIDEYKAAGVPAADVWAQSFNLDDVLYWLEHEPEFGRQAVYLDGRYRDAGFDPMNPQTFEPGMRELKALGVNYIAPPLWMLVTAEQGAIVPSAYAREARAAGLRIIAWTLERSGPLATGGGWFYQSIAELTDSDGVMFELLHVLARDVGVVGVFSDWPATVTYYANCMALD